MKFNDDSLMFDLDSSCLDCLDYDTIDSNYSNPFVDFVCEDLEPFSNNIKACTLIDEIDLFSNANTANRAEFGTEFCDITDSLFVPSSNLNFTSNLSNHNSSSSGQSSSLTGSPLSLSSDRSSDSFDFHSLSIPVCSTIESLNQDKREMKKKLLDLTQRKLTHTLCFDSKLRNQVLLKSALKSVNQIDDDNLLGTEGLRRDKFDSRMDKSNKQDKSDKMDDGKQEAREKLEKLSKDQDDLMRSPSPRKRNFKSNTPSLFNDQEMFEERAKKQKLSHLHGVPEECFIDENSFNNNDDLTLNNLANCFIKLRTQHTHD